MKVKAIVFALAVFFGSAVVCSAQKIHIGTWKLNDAKSKIAKGSAKNHTVVYEMAGDMIKVTVDGTAADGSALHNEWTGKFNGRDYAETGSATADKRSYRMINRRTLSFREKMGRKIITTGTITVARNGKSRTVVSNTTDASGKHFHNVAFYDKQ